MHSPNRFFQYTLKPLLLAGIVSLSHPGIAQNPPAAEPAATSAPAPAPPEKPIYADSVERDNAQLAKAFTAIAKADELQWLETPDEKVLALYKAGETRKTKGLLLIMHAPEVPQLWPANLENIRRNLPLYSWATMALPLPAKYSIAVPEREAPTVKSAAPEPAEPGAAPSEPTANTTLNSPAIPKPLIARDKLINGRVDAAIGEFNKLGQLELGVLVDNSSAPHALAALYNKFNSAVDNPLKALILVNLQDQEPLTKAQLAAIFAGGKLRVMDVFFNPDSLAQSELRRLHQAEAMRQNVKDYQQLILPNQPSVAIDDTKSFWLGKVHGFLTRKLEDNKKTKDTSDSKADANTAAIK